MKGVIHPMVRDDLGDRMKNFYENIPKYKLIKRMPVAVRLRRESLPYFYARF